MARIRTIKPEAFLDEELWDAEQETGLPLFRAFAGLWCHADREGRFEWRARMLKAGILPYWDGDFSDVLDALATRGFIVKYASGTREYGWIRSFTRHQVINNRESESEIPPPPETCNESRTSTRAPRVDDACPTREVHAQGEGKGKEGSLDLLRRSCPAEPDAATTVIDHLNEATGSQFQHSDSALKHVNARLREGHSAGDLIAVVNFKAAEWLDDGAMRQYLRPATLFSPQKFPGYLAAAKEPRASPKDVWADIEPQLSNWREASTNDPIAQAVIADLGGFSALGMMTAQQLVAARRSFVERYRERLKSGRDRKLPQPTHGRELALVPDQEGNHG